MDFVFRRRYRGRLKAVILDWAGTTMDFGCCAPAAAFIQVFNRQGVGITLEQAREPMGMHKRDHIEKILQMPAVAKRWREVHSGAWTAADVERMYREFVPIQLECIAQHADLIPGTVKACGEMRARGLKIGTSTGYNDEMLKLILDEGKKRGFEPDSSVCATMVTAGRPAPWMCFQNAMNLGVYPMEACVKAGDTPQDIYAGLNAGVWTVGFAVSGNMMGLPQGELNALKPRERETRRERAYTRLAEAGAHYVVDGIWDLPDVLDAIDERLAQGERP